MDLNEYARHQGYAITIKRSNGKATYLHCDRSGDPDDRCSGGENARPAASSRCNCPFLAVLRVREHGQRLEFTVQHGNHNHLGSHPILHPTHRQYDIARVRPRIIGYFSLGMTALAIINLLRQEALRARTQAPCITPSDLRNLHQYTKRLFLGPKTSIQAVLTNLKDDWEIYWKTELGSDIISQAFFASKESLRLFRRYPFMLWIDATYKTNRYHMPLVNIVGMTATKKTFFVACVFVSSERQESYDWVLDTLRDILDLQQIPVPETFFCDNCTALLTAIDQALPGTKGLLCYWHIMKNIEAKVRPILQRQVLLSHPDRDIRQVREDIMEKWKSAKSLLNTVIFALTVPEMERAWKAFVKTYRGEVFKPAIKYIQKTWMQDDIQRRFLRCYTNESRHFDQIASSRVEGAHSAIKRDLRVSTGEILKTMQSIGRTAHHAFCEAQYSLQREQCFLHRNLRQPLFKDVLGHVAAFALQTVKRSLEKYLQDRRIPAE